MRKIFLIIFAICMTFLPSLAEPPVLPSATGVIESID